MQEKEKVVVDFFLVWKCVFYCFVYEFFFGYNIGICMGVKNFCRVIFEEMDYSRCVVMKFVDNFLIMFFYVLGFFFFKRIYGMLNQFLIIYCYDVFNIFS